VLIHDDAAPPENHGENAHIVRFYDDNALLMEEVAGFLEAALSAGGAGIVIATPEHTQALRERLPHHDAAALARIVFLDARASLERLLVDGEPDGQRFRALIRDARAQLGAHDGPLHAFGEMVALQCADGHYSAAIRLEQLWNALSEELRFSLFCAYPWQAFPSAEFAAQFEQVCAEHQHACTQAPGRGLQDVMGKPLQLLRLERKAQALDAEVARRQEAERALLRRERELADFVENAAEGLHRVGRDGTILWANKAELQMLGYSWDEYVGRHIAEFHLDAPVIDSILATLLSGGTLIDQPARLRCKDGSVKHVLIHSNGSFEDGKLRYTRCFTRDATERRQRDEALAQRDRMLLNAPMAAALLVGPEFTFRLANRRYSALVGRGELDGKNYAEVFPELRDSETMRLLEQVYRSGEPCSVDELRIELVKADGAREERFLQFNLEPLTNIAGEEQGVIVVAVDVTDKVRDRRSLERAHAERERLLDELTTANRAKDEFLAMLGHELRNPLSPIVTALQLMRMRGETGAMREREIIERQVEHLVRLVDDLMDVARATRGQIELKSERGDIAVPLAKAVEMAGPLFAQRGHRLAVEVEEGMQWEGDPMRLAQVVSNLLTNAARYTGNGGAVTLSARRDGPGWLRIGVLDNGIGLAPEVLPQVFGLFFQGKRSVDRVEGGLGIGLALVKNIVELHGGTVEAHSAGLGHGSEFVVRLPVPTVAPATAPAPAAVPALPATGRRIMIVDDNADAAETLGMLLSAHGHTVAVFNDPVSALAAAGSLQPDIAVLDIGLPVLDGYELAARLRALPGFHACRLIALSGYGQDADKARSEAAGFERHLVKPITPDQVARLAEG
jgi:PAS domain S-box-containing protein